MRITLDKILKLIKKPTKIEPEIFRKWYFDTLSKFAPPHPPYFEPEDRDEES